MSKNTPPSGPSATSALLGLTAGLVAGAAAFQWPGAGWDGLIGLLEPAGTLWLAALRMLVVPLMISTLIVAIGRAGTGRAGLLGIRTISWILGLLAGAAIITVMLSVALLTWAPVSDATRAAFRPTETIPEVTAVGAKAPTLRDWVVNLVPANPVQAAAEGNLLALIVGALLFGVALRYVPDASRQRILTFAEAVADWTLALAGLLFRVLPMAVFILTLSATARSGAEMVAALAYYVVLLAGLLMGALLLLYPLTARFGGIPIFQFAKAVWPTQVLAFSTRSSAACLPAMLETARRGLRIPSDIAGFTLPLAVSSFKLNMGVSANFQMLFLLHLYGLNPDARTLGLAVLAVTMQSFSTPGLPSGAMWTTTPVYLALGIPLEGIVLTNVVDTIPDLFKTTANVTGDLSLTAIVARQSTMGPGAR